MRVTQRFRIAARPTVRHCTGGRWLAACAVALCAIAFAGSPAVGDGDPRLAPDFALRSLDQGNQRLSEYRGDVVVLCFWASWCGDCRRRLPQLNELYDEHRAAGLAVLGINLDEDAGRAREFARVLGLEFPVLLDSAGAVSRLYDVERVPQVVVVDRDGSVRHVYDASGEEAERWRDDVLALLRE